MKDTEAYKPPNALQEFLQWVWLFPFRPSHVRYCPEWDCYVRTACFLGMVRANPFDPLRGLPTVGNIIVSMDGYNYQWVDNVLGFTELLDPLAERNLTRRPSARTIKLFRDVLRASQDEQLQQLLQPKTNRRTT